MHIVLSGYYGFDNVGDEAILYAIITNLKQIKPDIRLTVLSNQPEQTKTFYQVEAVNRWKISEVRRALRDADGLISGGGSLLQDQTSMKSIPYYAGIIKMAQWQRTPVFIYAQGMGPIQKPHNKWIVKHVLNKVQGITVRDEASRNLLTDIGVKKDIQIVPDPVLGLDGSSFQQSWMDFSNEVIAVSVRDWPSEHPFKERIAVCLNRLSQEGYTILFIPMHGDIDEKTSRKTADLMSEESIVAPGDLSLAEKIALVGESKLLIGMRLHSLIFAADTGTPFVGLSYDPKIDAFAYIFKQPVAGHVTDNDWDSETLFKTVQNVLDDYDVQQQSIKVQASVYMQEALGTAKMAIAAFEKL